MQIRQYCLLLTKISLCLLLTLVTLNSFSQRKVSRIIIDKFENSAIPFTHISEEGTDNVISSGIDGTFELFTLNDSCTLNFWFIDYCTKTVEITSDTTLTIIMQPWNHEIKWKTVGLHYNPFNSTFGLSFSNGYDEYPLIHFEDFSDHILYKVNTSTDFDSDYSFGIAVGWLRPFRWLSSTSVEYSQYNYSTRDIFDYKSANLSATFFLKSIRTSLIAKTGFSRLNSQNNAGASLGLEKRHNIIPAYIGFSTGYYSNYFTYSVYVQSFIIKHSIGLRLTYDRINKNDLFSIGLNVTLHKSREYF